jgi:hypothetical protein
MNEPQVPLQRGPGHPLGFVRTIQGKIAQLTKEIGGLASKTGPRFGYGDGKPASYVGEKIFTPESASFTLDLLGEGDNVANQQPVNYVVRDGVVQTVPVHMDGPGVFLARWVEVTIYQRWWSPDQQHEVWLPIPYGGKSFNNLNTTDPTRLQTIKWSVMHNMTFSTWTNVAPSSLAPDGQTNIVGTNFFWNLIDQDSQRRVGSDLIPDQVLLPQGYQHQTDGDLWKLPVPWLFERRGRVDFEFQLINPILQLDPTATIFPFTTVSGVDIDARENNGTVRDQSVLVRVEMHGTKFYNERDQLLRAAV